MNNVWTFIALRISCAARRTQRTTPLPQLFNCSTRSQSIRYPRSLSRQPAGNNLTTRLGSDSSITRSSWRAFSSSTRIGQSQQQPDPAPSPNPGTLPESRLQDAPTTGSHTEGSVQDEEELTWRDYDPEGGMPLPDNRERTQEEIQQIFDDADVSEEVGNYVLKVMHWRRMSGALIDTGLDFPRARGISKDMALKGLAYLRDFIPDVDEQAMAQVWAEEEQMRLEEEIKEKAIKLGLYKPLEPEPEPFPGEEEQGTAYGREKSGTSQFARIRKENEAAWEIEKAARVVAQYQAELSDMHAKRGPLELAGGVQPHLIKPSNLGVSIYDPQSIAWLQPIERQEWVKYYENHAQVIKDDTIPQYSLLRRLGPSFIMLCVVVFLADYLADNYYPPPKSARLWPDIPPAVATLMGLTGMLVATFLCARIPPFWRTYSTFFTLIPVYPHPLSLVGAIFRHDTARHLGINLLSLWLFGLILNEDVGRGTYLAIFLASGATGGFTSLIYHVLRREWTAYIFGASSAVLGTIGAACVLRPNGTLRIYDYEFPIAAWIFAAIYIGSETFAVLSARNKAIDHVGHLGGLLSGMAMGLWLKWKWKQRRGDEPGLGGRETVQASSGIATGEEAGATVTRMET